MYPNETPTQCRLAETKCKKLVIIVSFLVIFAMMQEVSKPLFIII